MIKNVITPLTFRNYHHSFLFDSLIRVIILIIIIIYCVTYFYKNELDDKLRTKYIKKESCFYDYRKYYPKLILVNQNREIILKEFNNTIKSEVWNKWINNNLTLIPLYTYGEWAPYIINFFPNTIEIIRNIYSDLNDPKIITVAFGKLQPNTQLIPHKDMGFVVNGMLRCHYGLIIPEKCGFIIENWIEYHNNDKWLTVDISKTHTTFNKSDKDRYVLIIDFERPSSIPRGDSKVKGNEFIPSFYENFFYKDQIKNIMNNF